MTNLDKELFNEVIIALVVIVMTIVMCGCKTQFVPMETVKTEYKDIVNTEYVVDSVVDTRFVFIKGDTVIDYRDRVKWRDRVVHDSININKTDTIRVPYPVEREHTKWEKVKMDLGGMAFGSLLLGIIVLTVYLLRFCYSRQH